MKTFNSLFNGAVRMAGMFIALGLLGAQAQADTQNSITALNASSAGGGTTVIKVEMAQPLVNVPAGFTINTPPRIALDFPNTANGLGKSVQEFGEGGLRSANVVQAGSRTRLVINLDQMLSYDTKIDGNNLLITLQGKAADANVVGKVSRFAEAKPTIQKQSLRDIDFRRGKNGEGRVQVDLSDPGIGIDIRQQGTTLIVDFLKTSLPNNLKRKLDVTDFATPVQTVDTFVQGDSVRMVIEPKGQWEHAAYQTDNKFIVELKQVVEDPDKLVKGSQAGYAGEKLTLNFQKIDVREALNVIADFTELNMVISDTVSGNITLRLKDVPWDQALDIILQSRGLDKRKNGNVIQVAPREEMLAKEKIELTGRQEISDVEELRTESFQLNYVKAEAFKKILTDEKQKILSKRGSAVWDERTNQLFIQDTPGHLEDIRSLIKKIDIPVRQVMIEARVVEASDKFGRSLGSRLGFTSPIAPQRSADARPGVSFGGMKQMNGATNSDNFTGLEVSPINSVNSIPFSNVNLPVAGAAGTFSMILFNAAATKFLSLELSALETDNKGKIISSPRVMTADQVEANIESGTEIAYLEASASGAAAVKFRKATLSLKVKPQITPEQNVIMDVTVTKDSLGDLVFGGIPTINVNKVNSQVLVDNGGTVVIGGVYSQIASTNISKVPLLGDLPIVGMLFKNTINSDDKRELLIFITPKIMKDALNLR
jgi:type IV pilus assembly protein PilQ